MSFFKLHLKIDEVIKSDSNQLFKYILNINNKKFINIIFNRDFKILLHLIKKYNLKTKIKKFLHLLNKIYEQ